MCSSTVINANIKHGSGQNRMALLHLEKTIKLFSLFGTVHVMISVPPWTRKRCGCCPFFSVLAVFVMMLWQTKWHQLSFPYFHLTDGVSWSFHEPILITAGQYWGTEWSQMSRHVELPELSMVQWCVTETDLWTTAYIQEVNVSILALEQNSWTHILIIFLKSCSPFHCCSYWGLDIYQGALFFPGLPHPLSSLFSCSHDIHSAKRNKCAADSLP